MYILQNAWKNIMRNKGRNILMAVIILAIIATSSVALIINNTAGGIIDNYKQRFGSEVTIGYNFEGFRESRAQGGGRQERTSVSFNIPDSPSPEQYLDFGNSEYLNQDMNQYTASIAVHNTDDLNFIDEDKGGMTIAGGGGVMMFSRNPDNENSSDETPPEEGQSYANLMAYNILPDEFKDGYRELADGVYPQNDGECIISYDLLENSGLKIGDTIILTSTLRERGAAMPMPGEEEQEDTTLTEEISYELTIVGYYDDLTDEYANDFMQNAYFNRRNEIITTVNTIISQMRDGFDGINVSAKYYLNNPEDLEKFAAELYAKGLDEGYSVTTDENSYNTIVKPVVGLKKVIFWSLLLVLALGAVILLLLSTLAIRERKYEVGVLRAMGMKKYKVAFGLLSEVITITLVCLILGLGAGTLAAQPVSDMLLTNQLQQLEEQNNSNMPFGVPSGGGNNGMRTQAIGMRVGGGGSFSSVGGGSTPAEALKEMDVNMGGWTILQIILVSLGLAIAASAAGIIHITRYEPIKILSDRT